MRSDQCLVSKILGYLFSVYYIQDNFFRIKFFFLYINLKYIHSCCKKGFAFQKADLKFKLSFVESIPSNFISIAASESLIGQVDVKTNTVHFYAKRKIPLPDAVGLIPFESVPLNEGDAFNMSSRSFIVPVPGIYHFHFSAVKYPFGNNSQHLRIRLQVNDMNTGTCAENSQGGGAGDGGAVVSLSASLRLAEGDKVNLYIVKGGLYDDGHSYTHFTGWLVEEELMYTTK